MRINGAEPLSCKKSFNGYLLTDFTEPSRKFSILIIAFSSHRNIKVGQKKANRASFIFMDNIPPPPDTDKKVGHNPSK